MNHAATRTSVALSALALGLLLSAPGTARAKQACDEMPSDDVVVAEEEVEVKECDEGPNLGRISIAAGIDWSSAYFFRGILQERHGFILWPYATLTFKLWENDAGQNFTFNVVNDQLFTPLLTYMSILNTLVQYEREFGAATFSVKGKAVVKKHGEVGFEDVFTGDSPSMGAAAYVAAPITFLLGNDFEPVQIEALDLAITSTEQPRTATLERVWVDSIRPRAGRTVPPGSPSSANDSSIGVAAATDGSSVSSSMISS